MKTMLVFTLLVYLTISEGTAQSVELTDEKRLIQNLTQMYEELGRVGRPVKRASDTLTVQMGLTILHLLELDESRQIITFLVWNKIAWDDIFLQWDPSAFGDIDKVHLPPSLIYTPDIMPYQEVPGEMVRKETDVVVTSKGRVTWVPPTKLTTLCPGLIPGAQEVTCHIKLGSWSEELSRLDLQPHSHDGFLGLKEYMPNPHWELVESNGERTAKKYPCCEEPYVVIEYTFTFARSGSTGSKTVPASLSFLLACVFLCSTM